MMNLRSQYNHNIDQGEIKLLHQAPEPKMSDLPLFFFNYIDRYIERSKLEKS